jgi:tetratricopeptide (TPR) repeat protein
MVADSASVISPDTTAEITPQVMQEVYSHPATPSERKSEWGDELFMIEKRTYQPEIKKTGTPGVKSASLYKVIYVEDLKVLAHPEWNTGDRFAFELNRSIHPRYANKNQPAGEAFYSDVDTIYYDNLLRAALQAFNKGECALVSEQLEVIRSKYPDDPNARFYMAMCLERMNRYSEALMIFEKMMEEENNVFREEAEWHTALNLAYLNEFNKAVIVFRRIASRDGFYAGAASIELKKY